MLKGEDASEFSTWLGSQLERLMHANVSQATREGDAILAELDLRTHRFMRRRGDEELARALEQWVYETTEVMAVTQTYDFQDAKRFEERLSRLEQESPRPGLRQLDRAMYCMGILRDRLVPVLYDPEPRTALYSIVDVLWREGAAEEAVRSELAGLIGGDSTRAQWELYCLRNHAFLMEHNLAFQDDRAAQGKLVELVSQELRARMVGTPVPDEFEKFLNHRVEDYIKKTQLGSPQEGLLRTAVIASTFAWYCRRTLDLRVRLIGAREFVKARVWLEGMIAAYRTGAGV